MVVGGGGHAKVLVGVLKKAGRYRIIGYTDEEDKGSVLGIPYLGTDRLLQGLKQKNPNCRAVIGVGTVGKSEARRQLQALLEDLGFGLPVVVSPQAIVDKRVDLERGTVVFNGAVINPDATIGACSIINTNSTIEHDCRISEHVHIAPGATVCGGARIGENCLIGAGAIVLQYVTICPNCIIGGGGVVIKDITETGTYVGNPARRIQK